MSCCGKKREEIRRKIPVRQPNNPAQPLGFTQPPIRREAEAFQYVGKTALTAIGPGTGRRYRFSHPGAIVEVDLRDSPYLATVPNLRKRTSSWRS
jgi:hypothetical protein